MSHPHRRHRFFRFLIAPVALLGLLGFGVAVAGPGGPGGFGPPGPPGLHHAFLGDRLDRVAEELDLSQDQIDAIKVIGEDARTQGDALRTEHEGLRDEGLALFTAKVIDVDAIESHRLEMLDSVDRGSALMADTMVQIATVLTPDQRLKLAEIASKFHENGGVRGRIHEHMMERHGR